MGYEKEAYLYQLFHYTGKKYFQEQGRRRRSSRMASAGPLFWTRMLSVVSLFPRFGSFFFVLTSDFYLLMQSSITLVARVIHRPT